MEGYTNTFWGICCPIDCQCDIIGNCFSCNTGLTFSDGSCYTCDVANCYNCLSNDIWQNCADTFELSNGICIGGNGTNCSIPNC